MSQGINTKDTARMLGLTPKTVHNLVSQGIITPMTRGSFSVDEILNFLRKKHPELVASNSGGAPHYNAGVHSTKSSDDTDSLNC